MFDDIKHALRLLRNDWRFSLTLISTLAIGIAASGAIFNVVNASLLRPLPIPQESEVYRLQDYTMNGTQRILRSSRIPNFLSIREESKTFSKVVGARRVDLPLIVGDAVTPTGVTLVSEGLLDMMGARARAGRLFTAEEERAGAASGVAVISHALWMRQFGGRDDVLGSAIRLDTRTLTLVGVLSPGFRFPSESDAWTPDRFEPNAEISMVVLGRLQQGVSAAQAEGELDGIARRAEAVRPDANRGLRFAMTPIRESLVGDQSRMAVTLLVAAVMLLLLASANVANLLLVRGIRRAQEIAVRAALGAERGRQVRQLLVESVVYAGIGTAIGLAIASPLSRMIVGLVPNVLRDQLGLVNSNVDWRAAVFAALVTGGVGVLAGVIPAFRVSRADISLTLRTNSRGMSSGSRMMRSFVVAEVALAAVLLFTAGLMIDSLERALKTDLGLRAEQLLSLRMPLPPRYDTAERRILLATQMVDAARALPGTESAGVVTTNPLARGNVGAAIEAEDAPLSAGQPGMIINHRMVSSQWLQTAGVTLVAGRLLESTDTREAPRVAVISQAMAARLWSKQDPLGRRIRQTRAGAPWITVVGVVGDVKDWGDWTGAWYVPYEQHAETSLAGTLNLMIRSTVAPAAALAGLRSAVKSIDPLLPLPEPVVMTALWESDQSQRRDGAIASSLFAISGWLLAAVGTYGVLAYLVSLRSREFGIRQALGASPRRLLRMVIKDGAVLVATGLALGAVLSFGSLQLIRSLMEDTSSVPVRVPLVVAGLLLSSALLASALPARRASRTSPLDVMRSE